MAVRDDLRADADYEAAKRSVEEWPIEQIADYYVDLPTPRGPR